MGVVVSTSILVVVVVVAVGVVAVVVVVVVVKVAPPVTARRIVFSRESRRGMCRSEREQEREGCTDGAENTREKQSAFSG